MKNKIMLSNCWIFLALLVVFSSQEAGATTIYSNDFQSSIDPVGSEWAITSTQIPSPILSTDIVPNQEIAPWWGTFLGQFYQDERITLSLNGLPKGQLTLSFDTYFIRSWDGEDSTVPYGKDYFTAGIVGGETFLYETFSNGNVAGQSYAGHGAAVPAFSGSSQQSSLGFIFRTDWDPVKVVADENMPMSTVFTNGSVRMDSVYNFSYTFNNNSDAIQFYFAGTGLQPSMMDESWGIDNIKLSTVPEPSSASLVLLGCAMAFGYLRFRRQAKTPSLRQR